MAPAAMFSEAAITYHHRAAWECPRQLGQYALHYGSFVAGNRCIFRKLFHANSLQLVNPFWQRGRRHGLQRGRPLSPEPPPRVPSSPAHHLLRALQRQRRWRHRAPLSELPVGVPRGYLTMACRVAKSLRVPEECSDDFRNRSWHGNAKFSRVRATPLRLEPSSNSPSSVTVE